MDRTTFEVELAKLHKFSFSWAMTCCHGNRSEAEDVLQTAYLKIMDGRASFDGRSTFKAWLFSVIRLTASENRRKAWLRSGLFSGWRAQNKPLDESETSINLKIVETKECRSQVLHAMAQLSTRQRHVLELVFYHDLTISEAAVSMKVSVGSARVHYQRGKTALKEILRKVGRGNE